MSECQKCGREGGHWIGCESALVVMDRQTITSGGVAGESAATSRPDPETVREVASAILASVGTEQMSQLYDALDDLVHEHYEPYAQMTDGDKAEWRTAVAEELGGEGYGDPSPASEDSAEHCAFGDCAEPRWSDHPRAQFCAAHKDPKNRK